jgi:hypothetical protein
MIISASRRTDIPAFYSTWMMNRIRSGYCTVPNPFNRRQVSRVSLRPEDVDVIVFWTRHPAPMFPYLQELDQAGFRYYFQYTLLDNPREIDPNAPALETAIDTFKKLSDQIGPDRVIWRYDPIVFSNLTGARYHQDKYHKIAGLLSGYTKRSVISVVDFYQKTRKRFDALNKKGHGIIPYQGDPNARFDALMEAMVRSAQEYSLQISSCSEEIDLGKYGIQPGKCIDGDYIHSVFGVKVSTKKDPSQRAECGCVVSKDIGMYDSCIFGCQYCYATANFDHARLNHEAHDPTSPSLLGRYENHLDG